jgi:hypothetical protein
MEERKGGKYVKKRGQDTKTSRYEDTTTSR